MIIQPASGTLRAGRSVIVTIFASRHASGRQLTVSPVGMVFTIITGRGHRFSAASSLPAAHGSAIDGQRRRCGQRS